jgi:protein-S-isoprenylcysteine O-methyltransferase Ste14
VVTKSAREMKMETKATKDRPGVIAPPPLIYVAVFALGYFLQRERALLIPESWLRDVGGWILVGLALALAFSGMMSMKRAKTHIDVYKPSTAIVSDGPFRFTRNPLYLSLTAMYIGVAVLKSMLWPLLVLPVALLVMQFGVIKREERYLAAKFGEEYLNYRARVRRWL